MRLEDLRPKDTGRFTPDLLKQAECDKCGHDLDTAEANQGFGRQFCSMECLHIYWGKLEKCT